MNLHTITFIKAHDRIFRVGAKVEIAGGATNYAISPLSLADGIVEEIPEVENACRIMYTGRPVFTIEDKSFTDRGYTCSLHRFILKYLVLILLGEVKMHWRSLIKLYLRNQPPAKFFGEADPLQQTIDLPWTQLEVAAVIKDVPSNSHLKFDALISWNTYDFYDGWDNLNAYTYVPLGLEQMKNDFHKRITELFQDHQGDIEGDRQLAPGDKIKISPIVENITDIHLSEYRDEDIAQKRSKTNVYILIVVVIFFLQLG